jgi:hypothetical protein
MRFAMKLVLAHALLLATTAPAPAEDAPRLQIVWPTEGEKVSPGGDAEKSLELRLAVANFTIRPVGQCDGIPACGHVHLAIDYPGESCNAPGIPGNSTNGVEGGDHILAHFGFCPEPKGRHTIAVALAHDDHRLILIDGKPVSAFVTVNVE